MHKKLTFISIIAIIISACSVTKNFKSTQVDHQWNATFNSFNGTEKIKFPFEKDALVYLNSEVIPNKGALELLLNNKRLINHHKVNHYKIDLNNNQELKLSGKDATGSFRLSYPTYVKKDISVQYNKNIELLALSFLLVNYEDYTDFSGKQPIFKDLYALNSKIAIEFKHYLRSENLAIIKDYLDRDFYLHYSNFVLSLDNFPNAVLKSDMDISHFKGKDDAEKLVKAFNDFYNEIRFDNFFKRYEPYYKEMMVEVLQNLPKENFITEMENYFGKSVAHYNLYPSLTLSFSSGFAVGGKNSIGNIFASFNKPEEINNLAKLNLGYHNSLSLRTICIHEFGHSFVNPAVDKVDENTINATVYLFEPIKNKMSEQGYNQWKICLYEHFNRANEVIIAKHLGDDLKANEILNDNIDNRSFIYLPQIIKKLEFWYVNEFFDKTYTQKVSEIIAELKK